MHSAPSVSYPVGRSAFAGRLLAGLAALGLAAAAAWTVQSSSFGWRAALAWVLALACAGFALRAWWRSPVGVLHWDGNAWHWQDDAGLAPGRLECALDLQARMLLRWQGETGAVRWPWVERKAAPSHWDALRRAVYSRASTPVPAAGKPPAAEQ
jgi:toxin CptA